MSRLTIFVVILVVLITEKAVCQALNKGKTTVTSKDAKLKKSAKSTVVPNKVASSTNQTSQEAQKTPHGAHMPTDLCVLAPYFGFKITKIVRPVKLDEYPVCSN